jgi:hypothetical protein
MKTALRLLAVATALAAFAATALAAEPGDGVWVDGTVHQLVTGPPPTAGKPVRLYVIAPVSRAHPLHPLASARTHGFGAHDHVIALTNQSTTFHGLCDLTLVVPGPKARLGANVEARSTLTPAGRKPLLYAARLDGHLVPLTWPSRIRRADQQGLAALVDTHTTLGCTVAGL